MTQHHFSLAWLLPFLLFLPGCSNDKAAVTTIASPPPLAIGTSRPALERVTGDGLLGSADFGEQRSCKFSIRNNQSHPITLKLMDKSCTCAGVVVPASPIEPGNEAELVITWSPKAEVLETSTVRLWAEIADSTGQHRLKLEANGTIVPKLMIAFPRGPLDLGKISPADLSNDQSRLVVEVYSRQQPFDPPASTVSIPGLKVISTEPMPADRLSTLQARAGYRLTIRPNPELPHGAIQAQLSIQTTIKPQPLRLDLVGQLDTSAISLNLDRIALPPRLSLRTGYRLPALTLTARYGSITKCELADITPPLFDARIQQLNDKTWRIELTLKSDAAALQQLPDSTGWFDQGFDQGSITLRLDHPDVKTLTVPIQGSQLSRE